MRFRNTATEEWCTWQCLGPETYGRMDVDYEELIRSVTATGKRMGDPALYEVADCFVTNGFVDGSSGFDPMRAVWTEANFSAPKELFVDRLDIIAQNYRWPEYAGASEDIDRQLIEIRSALTPELDDEFDYYAPDIRSLWRPAPQSQPSLTPTGADAQPARTLVVYMTDASSANYRR